jgi:hypothetical protein
MAFIVIPSAFAFEMDARHSHFVIILHFSNDADSLRLFRRGRALQHQRDALAGSDFHIVLIEAAMNEGNDAPVGLAAAFPQFDHFGLDANGIAVEKRFWKAHLVPPEIGYRGAKRSVSNRNSNHHA